VTLGGDEHGAAYTVAFSSASHRLAVGYEHGRVVVWDLATGLSVMIPIDLDRAE